MYCIPATNMNRLQEKIDKLNRKAVKLHCAPITLDVISTEMILIERLGMKLLHYNIEVVGDQPIINGWAFIATLEHTTEGTILRSVPGMVVDGELTPYREVAPKCEHCNKNRKRNDTYVLRSENGQYKQVGSNCLGEFCQHNSPQAMASYAELLILAGASASSYEDDFGGKISGIGTENLLAWVSLAIRTYGWVSSKKAQESFEPICKTSQTAMSMIEDAVQDKGDAPRPTDADRVRAEQALEWIRNLEVTDDTSDYIHNLTVACKADSVPWRQIGIVASLFVAYDNAHGGYEKKERKVSQYQGAVGGKITRIVTVKRVSYSAGQYGTTSIYAMEDADGNQYTWFSTKDILDKNVTYDLVGTVKEHNDRFKNIKTTVLTRCRVNKVIETAA